MALTEKGFSRRTFDDILSDKITKAKELFGEDIDTSENTPFGKFLRINAYDQALTEEEAENIYYSIFPSTATGQNLDRLCWIVGISRNPAVAAEYTINVSGTAGTEFPVGTMVSTDSELTFYCVETKTVGADGTVQATVACTQAGEIGNIVATDIVKMVNPVANITGVVGVSQTVTGSEVEDDYDLRSRYDIAKEGLGSCNEPSIRAALMNIPTVESVGIIVNETNETDSAGRPARSFQCYVAGGANYEQQIAEAIFANKPIGILTHGAVSKTVTDEGGYTHTVKFSHTEKITVYVRISITTEPKFAGDTGKQSIKENMREYIDGLGVGKTLILTSLYGLIHDVEGVVDISEIKLSTDQTTWLARNITAESYQNCVFGGLRIKLNDATDYEVIP